MKVTTFKLSSSSTLALALRIWSYTAFMRWKTSPLTV
jgi:hypothetical protein